MEIFTIYTLGDVEIFTAALTAVAMVFSDSNGGFFVGPNGLGLGALAIFGLLVSLTLALFSKMWNPNSVDIVGTLVILVITFVGLFVPKFPVQIEDYYDSGQVSKVDGVPLGVVFPAAMMSTIVKNVNDLTATVYATTEGGYYTNVMSPLRLLNSLKQAAIGIEGVDSSLTATIREYAIFCLAGRAGFDQNAWKNLTLSQDYIAVLTQEPLYTGGFTRNYITGSAGGDSSGVLTSCIDMRIKLSAAMAEFFDSTAGRNGGFAKVLNGSLSVVQQKGKSAVTGGVVPVTSADFQTAFVNLTQGNEDIARNFALMSLFTPHVNGALHCAPNVANRSDMAQCMAFAQAHAQRMEDSAAAGSTFQRLMVFGMNGLLFLFFCLSPVVAIVMLITLKKGMSIATSYLLFGAWCQSWFVGASIINFYIQKQIQYELAMNGGIGNLNWDNMGRFFDSLQIKIGLAGDMLASVPLIMMAVMSGSVYGMTALASRWGSRDHYDEKVNAPSVTGSAPLHAPSAGTSSYHGVSGVKQEGYMEAGKFSMGDGARREQSLNQANALRRAETLQNTEQQAFGNLVQSGFSGADSNALSDAYKSSGMTARSNQIEAAKSVLSDQTLTKEQKEASRAALSAAAGARLEAKVEAGGMVGKAIKFVTGAGATGSVHLDAESKVDWSRTNGLNLSESQKQSFSEGFRKMLTATVQHENETSAGKTIQFSKTVAGSDSLSNSTALSKLVSESKEFSRTESETQALQRSSDWVVGNNVQTIGQTLATEGDAHETREKLQALHNRLFNFESAEGRQYTHEYNNQRAFLQSTTMKHMQEESKIVSQLRAASAVGGAEYRSIAQSISGMRAVEQYKPAARIDTFDDIGRKAREAGNVPGSSKTAAQIQRDADALRGQTAVGADSANGKAKVDARAAEHGGNVGQAVPESKGPVFKNLEKKFKETDTQNPIRQKIAEGFDNLQKK